MKYYKKTINKIKNEIDSGKINLNKYADVSRQGEYKHVTDTTYKWVGEKIFITCKDCGEEFNSLEEFIETRT